MVYYFQDLMLTFQASVDEYGKVITRDLVKDGKNVPVSNENRYFRFLMLSTHTAAKKQISEKWCYSDTVCTYTVYKVLVLPCHKAHMILYWHGKKKSILEQTLKGPPW